MFGCLCNVICAIKLIYRQTHVTLAPVTLAFDLDIWNEKLKSARHVAWIALINLPKPSVLKSSAKSFSQQSLSFGL